MKQPISVHISAGGQSSRMREIMAEMGYQPDYPKHLLPTGNPNDETLLGRIVSQALALPEVSDLTIHTSEGSKDYVDSHPDIDTKAKVVARTYEGTLGPILQPYLEEKKPVISASGDFYLRSDWGQILGFHESHNSPITYVAGNSYPTMNAAVFRTNGTRMAEWERIDGLSEEGDLVNVGLYLFKPHPGVHEIFTAAGSEHHEHILGSLISEKLIEVYVLEERIYNVNNPAIYAHLLRDNQAVSVAPGISVDLEPESLVG
jgi:NDP-sugar pyrophosphorylase family protein